MTLSHLSSPGLKLPIRISKKYITDTRRSNKGPFTRIPLKNVFLRSGGRFEKEGGKTEQGPFKVLMCNNLFLRHVFATRWNRYCKPLEYNLYYVIRTWRARRFLLKLLLRVFYGNMSLQIRQRSVRNFKKKICRNYYVCMREAYESKNESLYTS